MEAARRIYFLGNMCHVCKSKSTPYTCEVCRMIFYCSPEHRRENWFDHSQICWAVNKISEAENRHHLYELFDGKDFTDFRHRLASRCSQLLKRSLKPWEFEMIYYTRKCDVCREFDWKNLHPCKECQFVYTCNKRHFRKNHPKWCKTMKIYSDVVVHLDSGRSSISELNLKDKGYESMADALSLNFAYENESDEVEKALTSELLTYPLTVFNGLRQIDAHHRKDLQILFVGAEIEAEVEPLEKWEKCLLHSLEKVDTLHLTFLGPELNAAAEKHFLDVCKMCRAQGKRLKCEFISGKFYHEYSNEEVKRPDLICALNSGMYRDFGFGSENSWRETILELFSRGGTPVLITEYTSRELKMVSERIRSLCGEDVTFLVRPQTNPFASLKPGLNIISEEEIPVIFKNYYYAILQNEKLH